LIAGVLNILANMASRTFHQWHATCKMFAITHNECLHLFNYCFPHPQGTSWTLFWFSNKLSTMIFSELQGLTLTLGLWLKFLWEEALLEPLATVHPAPQQYGTHAHLEWLQARHSKCHQNQPPWSFRLTGQDWPVYQKWQQHHMPNHTSCAMCHWSNFQTGWKTKPDIPSQRPILAGHWKATRGLLKSRSTSTSQAGSTSKGH
jgi:hypothetical protein